MVPEHWAHLKTQQAENTDIIPLAIRESREAVEHKVEEVRIDVSLLQQDLRKVTDRVTKAETRVSTAEDELATLKTRFTQLLRSMAILEDMAEDAENRSRRNNLRLIGVPEGVDTPDMATMLEE